MKKIEAKNNSLFFTLVTNVYIIFYDWNSSLGSKVQRQRLRLPKRIYYS